MNMAIMEIDKLCYACDPCGRKALHGITIEFERGAAYTLAGESGQSKTALLSLMGGKVLSRDGEELFAGKSKPDDALGGSSGVVFQSLQLMPNLTALQNILLSMDKSGSIADRPKQHAQHILSRCGLSADAAFRKASELSHAEQQRIGIAIALSNSPDIILIDEPDSNLAASYEDALLLLCRLANEDGKSVIMISSKKAVQPLEKAVILRSAFVTHA